MVYLSKHYDALESEEMVGKVGAMYSKIYIKRGRVVIATIGIYYFRRLLIPVSVVYNNFLIVQVIIMVGASIANVINLGNRPMEGGTPANRMELLNEVTIIFVLYTMICQTDWVPNDDVRFGIGFVTCGIISAHAAFNIILLGIQTVKKIILVVKRCKVRSEHKRIMAQKREAD